MAKSFRLGHEKDRPRISKPVFPYFKLKVLVRRFAASRKINPGLSAFRLEATERNHSEQAENANYSVGGGFWNW